MTKAEKQHLDNVASLGCIICRRPAEIHHIRKGAGMAMKSSHFDAIPLCPDHHRNGGYGTAIHAGQKAFEEKFGTEEELLQKVRAMLYQEEPVGVEW
jgi:hypothetical protein